MFSTGETRGMCEGKRQKQRKTENTDKAAEIKEERDGKNLGGGRRGY